MQEEKKRKEAEEKLQALEAAKLQVLGCPMCGKGLRTAAVSDLLVYMSGFCTGDPTGFTSTCLWVRHALTHPNKVFGVA